jgi:polysaccharide pyruvyl transferase WcaK-like protein
MSFCCVRKTTLARLGAEPFSRDLCGPEDCFLHYQLALQGPIVFQRTPLVAYRLRRGSLSEDRTRVLSDWTRVFVRLAGQFQHAPDRGLRADFRRFHAQKRREYAQVLLGLGATHEARHELRQSLRNCRSARSQAKSLALLAASLLPAPWQPRWPRAVRSAGPASASATVTVRGEIAPVDPAPPMPPPRAAVALLGVTRNTHNHGVRVLPSSAVEALTAHHPDLELIALDYQHEPALWNEETAAGVRPLSLVNLRFSWRVFLPNNVFTLLLLVALVRLVPSRRLRVWILSRNGTLRQLLRARVCLAFSGGDSFSDLYGLERLIYVTAPQLLALWVEVPLVQLPQTYGPFRTAPARWIARHILLRSRAVYSRDPAGPTIVAQLTRGRAPVVKVAPDWGFLLPPRPLEAAIDARLGAWAREHTVVGVNPSQLLDSGGYSGDNMFGLREDYRGLMRRLIDRLLADPTYFVLLVPHVGGEAGEAERPLCRELLAEFAPAHPGRIGFIDLPLDHRQTKHVIGRCDLFIGARMHACIAAASQGVPTLALAYSDKFTGVMAVLASEAVTVVDLRHEGLPRIESALAELDARRHELRNDLNDRMPNIRHHIVTSADTLLAA